MKTGIKAALAIVIALPAVLQLGVLYYYTRKPKSKKSKWVGPEPERQAERMYGQQYWERLNRK